ncbi:MAG TPA: dTMP kinase [Candidatus Thalassarchaeaceae archaeon]|jgi:dTMP kinase|nr:dTMP kinase [Candidatus Thalassarchaeaceae archaeon]|tara:strand:- start:40019 stop:41359 length:1341 start_codon:yes stop_codon:yes gene_type:complete
MYLFSVEGGDGSGKGLATKIVSEILDREFSFSAVEITGEPRRDHALGRLAIDSVRKKAMFPEQEAGLFAADRLDHSHGWILPRLLEGKAVVSERNIHSSLVYQGIVGGIGVERVSHMNSAALIPDLCIWVDCDPEVAMNRISSETLRGASNKSEYFETTNLQIRIRGGYTKLLSGEVEMPVPFDMGAILGPISNEGSEQQLRRALTNGIRAFLHKRPTPINVDKEAVDQFQIRSMVQSSSGQSTLSGLGIEPTKSKTGWLDGTPPWKILKRAQEHHETVLSSASEDELISMPKNILNHSVSSICGTLSLVHAADVSALRSSMGPVRCVSERHTQRIIKFLKGHSGWISQHKSLIGREAPRSQLKEEYFSFGRMVLAIWPFRSAIRKWQVSNPNTHLRFCLGQLVKSGRFESAIHDSLARLSILGGGRDCKTPPENRESLVDWWNGK